MAVWGISRVKDEADVIETVVGWMLTQVDHVLIADNASTDGTREILAGLPVELLDDPLVAYYQSEAMSALAARAADGGAEWVVPFDADEIWRSPHGPIREVLNGQPQAIAAARVYDHVATGADFAGDPVARMPYRRRESLGLPKVACRPLEGVVIAQGNHAAHYPGEQPAAVRDLLEVHHFPYRSPQQFVSKIRNGAAAYAATDLPADIGQHWRQYGHHLDVNGEQAVIDEIFFRWFHAADPEHDPQLVHDPVP